MFYLQKSSIFIETKANEDVAKHPDVENYDYYVCGLKIAGNDYTVKSVVSIDNNGNKYYDHKLTSIEKGKLLDIIEQSALENANADAPTIQKAGSETIAILAKIKDKRLLSILQLNSSKVVDANGEPMVTYHGTELYLIGQKYNF